MEADDLIAALIQARHRQGLTQQDVADRMGLTNYAVSRFECRSRRQPMVATIDRYARALGYRVEWNLVLDD